MLKNGSLIIVKGRDCFIEAIEIHCRCAQSP